MGHDVPYLNTTQAGEYLGVHPRTIKRWIRDGLPAKRTPGGHYRIVRADLDAWLERRRPNAKRRDGARTARRRSRLVEVVSIPHRHEHRGHVVSVETDRITDAHRAEALLDQIDGLAALIRDGLPAPDSVDFALDDETGRYNITCHYADPTPAITIELLRHLDNPNAEVSGGGYRRYSWDRPGDLGVVVDVRDQDRGAARLLARAATIAEVGS